MAFGDLTGIGKLVNNNGDNSGGITLPKLNLMTISAVRYGYSAEFSVLTSATSLQELYDEIYNSNIRERWVICHGNANANLSGNLHSNINFVKMIRVGVYPDDETKKVIEILGQYVTMTTDNTNLVKTENKSANSMYMFPYGGGSINYGDCASGSIIHIQELI